MRSPVWQGDWPITQAWGYTTLSAEPILPGTGTHWHCGVDIGMPTGTELYAARAGVVTRCGNGLLGVHSGPEIHYYIHIDRAYVGLGAAVATGQLIAKSGARVPAGGYLTGPHLHFERNSSGLNVPPGIDPMPLLQPAAYSSGSGQIEVPDVTPEQDQKLTAIFNFLSNPSYAKFDQGFLAILADLQALRNAVAALKLGSGSGDSAALLGALAAIQAAVDALGKDLAAARLIIDKLDRGD